MKAAVIVAHPDDEIIWSGGLILQHPRWDWTVLSLSRADDPDRAPKFRAVCSRLGVRGFISDLADGNPLEPIDAARDIGRRIMDYLTLTPWDLCVTHGANGEYGHPRHQQVHAEVRTLVEGGILECDQLWTFAYACNAGTARCRADPDAEILLRLTRRELTEKRRLVQHDYGYAKDSFEVRVCVSPEGFNRWQRPTEELLP